ncbi:MAG: hypothetical protein ACLT8I_24165 [Blautia faecis]
MRTGKLLYEFEKCKPGQVQYCVEFMGQKSKANAESCRFLGRNGILRIL